MKDILQHISVNTIIFCVPLRVWSRQLAVTARPLTTELRVKYDSEWAALFKLMFEYFRIDLHLI